MSELWADEPVRCLDSECPQPQPSAQPEADGDLRYYACLCGQEFGYQRAGQADATCAAGVPEEVRRAASFGSGQPAPVFLGSIGRRP